MERLRSQMESVMALNRSLLERVLRARYLMISRNEQASSLAEQETADEMMKHCREDDTRSPLYAFSEEY